MQHLRGENFFFVAMRLLITDSFKNIFMGAADWLQKFFFVQRVEKMFDAYFNLKYVRYTYSTYIHIFYAMCVLY